MPVTESGIYIDDDYEEGVFTYADWARMNEWTNRMLYGSEEDKVQWQFDIARKKAEESTLDKARVGAVITRGGRVLATGVNHNGYEKMLRKKWTGVHAEEAVIVKCLKKGMHSKLVGATIWVSRVKKDGSVGLAKPCGGCMKLIEAVGIKRVRWTV